MMLKSSAVGFKQRNQYRLVQVPTRLVKRKGILSGGHRCGSSHEVFGGKSVNRAQEIERIW